MYHFLMSHKILIIEDDIPLYNLYAAELKLKGYDVSNVSDGLVAYNAVKTQKPDLVLLDIVLPGRNGVDILQDIKSDTSIQDTKVIMLTNYGGDANINKSVELGAEDYILKYNVVPSDVSSKVATILRDTASVGVALKE